MDAENLKKKILQDVAHYYHLAHQPTQKITPQKRINYAGRVFDAHEMQNLVDAALDFWLTAGKYAQTFETKLASFLKVPYALLVNSGSSANLLALATLTSPLLKERAIKAGDEVITLAAGFPTTIAPIIQLGAIPVFVDIELETANIDTQALSAALSPKTKAIFIAHTLGNPFDLHTIKEFCTQHKLWLIEDNCDALGATYAGKYTGTFGDIGTSSFYPAHHITMGEGGAVYMRDPLLKKIALSIRDWGRDCWCEGGRDNTCKKRFSHRFEKLPFGYDHKYVYSHFGYNLKATDLQASIGVAQLDKLPAFIQKRQENHVLLKSLLQDFKDIFYLPNHHAQAMPSWFGFLLILRENTGFNRNQIVEYLESKNIQTRNLFGGNMLLQPAFAHLQEGKHYRVIGDLARTNKVMRDGFWVGVYPGLDQSTITYIADMIGAFIKGGGGRVTK
ncbi:lipopolysaccharide biosynthesis protein RfbH [Helicobacter sp. 12S02634-8]|uniref:lipopolysaccharide biosynthesis protein RfbH n=1 Tax=Helicobacter sp. 12S02634-8 TaxID=1476199 RepID=UPI000BA7B39D|nr:lipopolysaccharide biosynthesis protein RfbH [Helicobacter sp. 12S02634-8]PAF47037.1 lipopolysaccharide biosynthesis protein RfbH [Helicobacter sp. 12S02634-8]